MARALHHPLATPQPSRWLGCRRLWPWLGALALVGCGAGAPDVVSGRIEADDMHVGSRIGGRVEQVLAREGDDVASGSLLIALESRELRAQRDEAAAHAAQAQAQLALLLAGTRAEELAAGEARREQAAADLRLAEAGFRTQEVEQARADLTRATADRELAQREFKRYEKLHREGVIGQSELDARRNALDTAEARHRGASEQLALRRSGARPQEIQAARAALQQAEADLDRLRHGARAEELDSARAALAAAVAAVARLEEQLRETRITAPQAAHIETLDLQPGDLVAAGQALAVLNLPQRLYVRFYVPQPLLGHVRVGGEVRLRPDTQHDAAPLRARVRWIATEAEFTPRNVQTTAKRAELMFEVKADLLEGQANLRPGVFTEVDLGH